MAYESHSFTFEDALARSNTVYEVEFTNWGLRTIPPPGTPIPDVNLQFPPVGMRGLPSSIAIAAIGPRSTIDRCWMTWDRNKVLTVPPADVPDPTKVISLPRILTIDAPLLFSQAARKGTLGPTQSWWEAMQKGLAYVFPFGPKPGAPIANTVQDGSANFAKFGQYGTTTILPETYISMFGTNIPFDVSGITERPFLQLVLYAKQPAFGPPTKRAAMARSGEWTLAPSVGGYFARIPIFGRRHVRVQFISHNISGVPSQIVDYRVGVIRNINESNVGQPTPVFEAKASEALAVAKDVPVNFEINNPCADYLTLHVTNGAVGPAGGAWTVVAED